MTENIPHLPWEINLKSVTWFLTDTEDGKTLKLVPLAPTEKGLEPTGMAIEIQFSQEVWERFAADVAAGEKHLSKVIVPQPGSNGHLN